MKENYHLKGHIIVGLVRQVKRTRDLLLQFNYKSNQRRRLQRINNTVTQRNLDLGKEDMRNHEGVRNKKLTRELKVQRLDGEKLAVTHLDQIAGDSNRFAVKTK